MTHSGHCTVCGDLAERLPFKPEPGREVLCSRCYQKKKTAGATWSNVQAALGATRSRELAITIEQEETSMRANTVVDRAGVHVEDDEP
jgi:CxxC-x17-CxxC domain-containing protein